MNNNSYNSNDEDNDDDDDEEKPLARARVSLPPALLRPASDARGRRRAAGAR